ncbi:EF-P 5-aminopentanol modification-associated protein YfmF [Salirhabdus salicampi]|uniref:EF-P 5-aminopentanol modification-associated protein YfmF n=1 Tax=Salirhabdus salicampi TaxID=476102 RepID=UPI0020C231F0|nr:pitrilysin family protein [Salirhabdus salicampi]MCP8616460.1 insulinase family protein [Salirhabdus salicampi]
MSELIDHQLEQSGYKLHIVPTKKFKTTIILVRFLAPLSKEAATKRALLPFVMQKGTKHYPTERELRTKLDELYGSQLSIDSSKKGENHLITLRMNFVNEKFLNTSENLMESALQLVKEVLFHPLAENDAFQTDIVAKEKETLKQKIESIKDQKMSYANMRLIDEMCENEPYSVHVHGYLDDLQHTNEQNLYDEYKQMIEQDQMDVYILGDVDKGQTEDIVKDVFSFTRKPVHNPAKVEFPSNTEPKEIVEKDQLQQAKLHLGFRTGITFKDNDYFSLQVYNGILGGFPHSKLFANVREKHSLAYYASSRFESHKGLLLVFSGIAPENFEKTKSIILEQVEDMKNGNFTDEIVEETKQLVIHSLKETFDHPFGIIELYYHQVLSDKTITPAEMFEQIEQVTKEDVVKVGQKVSLDTTYFLTSANEGDLA